ncbi:SRPBCC family protein [Nibribacter koreensis]|uniref:Ligand-binding SRPBCC domain-containing protein n=1 Tax=Nibribacter koreensis TaxID=1084519 RepID=A0ABP8F5W9_9BACT
MPVIHLETCIAGPPALCFDLSRSIDLHTISTEHTGEKAIAGVTTGLIGLGQTVTWRAKHFGVWQTLTSKITAFEPPFYFEDEMVQGAFKSFRHEHHFVPQQENTLMRDVFHFTSPLGILGELANRLVLTNYMTDLLKERNRVIKEYAESGQGALLLQQNALTQNKS